MRRLAAMAALLALAACGEIDQSKAGAAVDRGDIPAYKGAANANVAKGWAPGDQTAWNKQIRERGQLQNEYNRTR
jgi:hypothetical protein